MSLPIDRRCFNLGRPRLCKKFLSVSNYPPCLSAVRLCTSAVSFVVYLVEAGCILPLHFSLLSSRSATEESVLYFQQAARPGYLFGGQGGCGCHQQEAKSQTSRVHGKKNAFSFQVPTWEQSSVREKRASRSSLSALLRCIATKRKEGVGVPCEGTLPPPPPRRDAAPANFRGPRLAV